jgi:hypothetical protein
MIYFDFKTKTVTLDGLNTGIKDYETKDLEAVFKLHNKKDWAVRLGQDRDENGRIDWEYWINSEPLTVIAFLTIAENIGAFQ